MPKYVVLVNWTEQGIASAKDTVQRAEAFRAMAQSMGGDTGELLWTLGRYDIVGFIDAPDDETAAAISMKVSGLGSVRTETLRAFTADEVSGIIGKLG
jgi:uncharacterized protein with GYD domain